MLNVLIDSDVILDNFLNRQPFHQNSKRILSLCECGILKGYVTPEILSNVYFITKKFANSSFARDIVRNLIEFLELLQIDKNAVVSALNSEFNDFEDALQNYSAENSEIIHLIITRNLSDYKKSNLFVTGPEFFINLFRP